MSVEFIIIGFALMLVCAGFVALFLKAFHDGQFTRALFLKGVGSLCFVTLGVIQCFVCAPSTVSTLIFIGLCFGIVGDEVIALCQVYPHRDTLAFIGGGSFFLVGHIFYIIALFVGFGVNWIAIAISFIVIAVLSFTYDRYSKFLRGDMKVPLALYLSIVATVTSVAMGVFVKRPTLGAGLFTLGGALFMVSDNILFAYKFGENPKFKQNVALHATYYLAQLLIAWSIALF